MGYAQNSNWEPQLEASPHHRPRLIAGTKALLRQSGAQLASANRSCLYRDLIFINHKSTTFYQTKTCAVCTSICLGLAAWAMCFQFLPSPPKSRILWWSALPWGQAQRQRPGRAADFCVVPRIARHSQALRWATQPVDPNFFWDYCLTWAYFDIPRYAKTHFEDSPMSRNIHS